MCKDLLAVCSIGSLALPSLAVTVLQPSDRCKSLVSFILETIWHWIGATPGDAIRHAFAHVIVYVIPRLLSVWLGT